MSSLLLKIEVVKKPPKILQNQSLVDELAIWIS